ncbi:MAG: hypothetical protein K9J79_05850 [Desulfobacteraceae bacterium]|nr:hypothetical protein [Desulfobacteraceae bacterium]MCF8094869.1 hypothetical protein [Desulfobacteraceae bacterium]
MDKIEAVYSRFGLAKGAQVRAEERGLLFYTASGPRLFFIPSGPLLSLDFFGSNWSLSEWLILKGIGDVPVRQALAEALADLETKEVIVAD